MNLKTAVLILALAAAVIIAGCTSEKSAKEEYCAKTGSSAKMSLTEAKQIAVASECGNRLKDTRLKDTYLCNENTGTWWIDLNIQQSGCSPACVINTETRQAEINYRCTGLVSPPSPPPLPPAP